MTERPRTRVQALVLVVSVTVALSAGLEVAGLPSAALFGSLAGGIAHAVTSETRLEVPRPLVRVAQGLVGVIIGATITLESLRAISDQAPTLALVTLGTIAISLVAGRALALREDVSRATGALALIAGGASGIVAMARDLGADERVVTVVQYLRVLVVLLTLPLVTTLLFDADTGAGAGTPRPADPPLLPSLAYVGGSLALGLLLAGVVRFPTSTLLAPFAVAAVVSTQGWLGPVAVPEPVAWVAYALIGAQVGLRFTRATLSSILAMLPAVLASIAGMVLATALMGGLLAWLTPVDGLTAYLATTPGGLFAVLATAADSGADVTYVMAVQVVRLLVVLACAPLLARWLARRD